MFSLVDDTSPLPFQHSWAFPSYVKLVCNVRIVTKQVSTLGRLQMNELGSMYLPMLLIQDIQLGTCQSLAKEQNSITSALSVSVQEHGAPRDAMWARSHCQWSGCCQIVYPCDKRMPHHRGRAQSRGNSGETNTSRRHTNLTSWYQGSRLPQTTFRC